MREPLFSLPDIERRPERRGSGRFRRTAQPIEAPDGIRLELLRNANARRSTDPRRRIADILAGSIRRYRRCVESEISAHRAALSDREELPACAFPTAIQ